MDQTSEIQRKTYVFYWLPAVDFMRNSMSFMLQKLHDFDDSVDGLA